MKSSAVNFLVGVRDWRDGKPGAQRPFAFASRDISAVNLLYRQGLVADDSDGPRVTPEGLAVADAALQRYWWREGRTAQKAPPPAAPSAEGHFYKNPKFREVRQFAETGAVTNIPSVAADAAAEENLDLPKRQTVSDAKKAPPTPEEIKEAPGGKGVSTLNRLVIDSEDPKVEKAIPANKAKMPKLSALQINNLRMSEWLKSLG